MSLTKKSRPSMTIEQRINTDASWMGNSILGEKLTQFVEHSSEYGLQDVISNRTWSSVIRNANFDYERGENSFMISMDAQRLAHEFAVLDATKIRKRLLEIPGVRIRRYSFADHVNGQYTSAHHISVNGTDVAHMVSTVLPANYITVTRDFPRREEYVQRFIEAIGESGNDMVNDWHNQAQIGAWMPILKNRRAAKQPEDWMYDVDHTL